MIDRAIRIKRDLGDTSASIMTFFNDAGLHRSSYYRWKNGGTLDPASAIKVGNGFKSWGIPSEVLV